MNQLVICIDGITCDFCSGILKVECLNEQGQNIHSVCFLQVHGTAQCIVVFFVSNSHLIMVLII